jgi:membrane-associated protease RseP (regulator of RpoE activity)
MGSSLLVLSIGVALNAGAFVLLRALVARLSGAHGGWVTIALRSHSRTIVRQRIAIAAAGPLGCYLVAGLLLATGAAMGGKLASDESSMRVTVLKGMPAQKAGIEEGDRIVSVNGEPSTDWNRLRAQTQAHPNEVIVVEVDRGGTTLSFTPKLGFDAKMGVSPPVVETKLGVAGLLDQALLEPGRMEAAYFAHLASWIIKGRPGGEVMGPAGAVREGARADGHLGTIVGFAGVINACWLWVAVIFALVLLPWPTRATHVLGRDPHE